MIAVVASDPTAGAARVGRANVTGTIVAGPSSLVYRREDAVVFARLEDDRPCDHLLLGDMGGGVARK